MTSLCLITTKLATTTPGHIEEFLQRYMQTHVFYFQPLASTLIPTLQVQLYNYSYIIQTLSVLYKWDHDGHLDFPTKREKKAKKQRHWELSIMKFVLELHYLVKRGEPCIFESRRRNEDLLDNMMRERLVGKEELLIAPRLRWMEMEAPNGIFETKNMFFHCKDSFATLPHIDHLLRNSSGKMGRDIRERKGKVTNIHELPKFFDATLKRVLKKIEKILLAANHGFKEPPLSEEHKEVMELCEAEINERLKIQNGIMRSCESYIGGEDPL
ncbi:hypothetical protein Tco_0371909 [Tanacetum coccineum]